PGVDSLGVVAPVAFGGGRDLAQARLVTALGASNRRLADHVCHLRTRLFPSGFHGLGMGSRTSRSERLFSPQICPVDLRTFVPLYLETSRICLVVTRLLCTP